MDLRKVSWSQWKNSSFILMLDKKVEKIVSKRYLTLFGVVAIAYTPNG
ncbi:MAG: hypothetical protein CLLPBCKN_007340 [Chroococcidiopsis cubana SAG 39.79]|nr:hypothetical protein [Chroococcidiopsis cubana SAG 39.79]